MTRKEAEAAIAKHGSARAAAEAMILGQIRQMEGE